MEKHNKTFHTGNTMSMSKYLFFPLWITFKIYVKKNTLVEQDFIAWCKRHNMNVADKKNFLYLAKKFPEYRYVFYYRLPWTLRHILNIFYPRQKMLRISTLRVGGEY